MSLVGQLLRFGINISNEQMEVYPHLIANGGLSVAMGRGRVYYVDPANGSDFNDGKTPRRALATIAAGYAKLTANRHDTLVYLAGATSASIVDTLDWAKSYTHFVGIAAPVPVAQRARIFNSGNTTASTPLLKVSGSGCIFRNLYIFQGSAVATVGAVEVTGSRNYFENVHFAGIGHATAAAGANAYSLKITAGSENIFVGCTFGVDTVKRTAANNQLWISGAATRNEFKDCRFLSYAEVNTYTLVKTAGGQDRYTIFDNCWFYNFWENFVGTLLEACDLTVTTTSYTLFINPSLFGIAELDAGDVSGSYVAGPATAAGCGIAVTPTT